ncbi:MAG: hypothetical protein GY699_20310 [Desulfobacteraceae bacterium]|nr:hypothetical protein [Desulfobacteraceae bacterium]
MKKELLDPNGIKNASLSYVLLENGLIFANILIGSFGMSPLKLMNIPLISILYLLFVFYMLVFALRKHLCTQCYYYDKSCHCGWGKLASKLYKPNTGNQKLGGFLAAITWSSLMVIPLVVMGFLLYQDFSNSRFLLLIAFVVITIGNNILHVKDCRECKMRYICPGSAAK